MKRLFRHVLVAAAVCGMTAANIASSHAAVTDAAITITGDADDHLTRGGTYQFSTAAGDYVEVYGEPDSQAVVVSGSNRESGYWTMAFSAPAGEVLTAKTYENAIQYPYNNDQPGLGLKNDSRRCVLVSGSFTIDEIVWGPYGYVEKFAASFEHHCERATPAARGKVRFVQTPAPPVLEIGGTLAADGKANPFNGKAFVHGTVTCSAPVSVYVHGTVTQAQDGRTIRGEYRDFVDCTPGTETPWEAWAEPSVTDTWFKPGAVQVVTKGSATDPNYNAHNARFEQSSTVTLVPGTP